MTISTWVVGATGLLGSAVTRRLSADPSSTMIAQSVNWKNSAESLRDLTSGTLHWLNETDATAFRLIWAAGAGVTATHRSSLAGESATFQSFIDQLAKEVEARGVSASVTVFLASSAGGIYSGGSQPPFTESSQALPVSAYGETKLAMERTITEFAGRTGVRVVVGRISNLYGPGQRIEKQQGFVSQLCTSMLTRRPISVYVSLDTTRDYIFSDDAATLIQACFERVESEDFVGGAIIKNIASHVPTTLGRVLHEAKLVFKRKPDVILASSPMAAGQVRDLRISSTVWPELNDLPRRSLLIGLAETRASMELRLHSNGDAR
jgi:UDP-glucose 4-epimerase